VLPLSFICSLLRLVQQIERALELDISGWNQMQIDRRRFYIAVAEQLADGIKVVAFIEEVGSEAVPESMKAAFLG